MLGIGDISDAFSFTNCSAYVDVVPIYPTEEESAIVPIACSEKFKEAFAYLRTFLHTDERSERAFNCTSICVNLNPANYTVWQYRRNLLKSLNKDIDNELKFTAELIEDNPKNYQVWRHRRVLIEWQNKGDGELKFTEKILNDDNKNYHAWQHRQWAIEHFQLVTNEELELCAKFLHDDLRNNSAWNYRFFLISSSTGYTVDILEQEVRSTLELIGKAPHNESSWNYLSGILLDVGLGSNPLVLQFCTKLYQDKKYRSPYLLSFIVDYLTEKIVKNENVQENTNEAIKLLDELQVIDPIRKKYWLYQKRTIENDYQK